MLTLIRRLYSQSNNKAFSCLLVFKKTQIFATMAEAVETFDQNINSPESNLIELEVFWCLQNMAYCCLNDAEIGTLLDSLLSHSSIADRWLNCLDLRG